MRAFHSAIMAMLVSAGAAGLTLDSSAAPGDLPSHCGAGETTVFSCNIGRKVASLCASDDIGPSRGHMRYVFGPMGRPELIYPAAGTDPRKAFTYGVIPRGDYVRFRNGNVSYVVFSHMQQKIGPFEGVAVERPGRKPVTLACNDGVLDTWQPVYKADLPRDEEGFTIP